jgi:hypothetical protein
MQVLLNTEPRTKDRPSLAAYLDGLSHEAFDHYGERIVRIEAHMSDANSPAKADTDDIHCTLEAQLAGLEPVVVKDRAATSKLAIHGAIGKLERAVTHAIGRHDQRGKQLSRADASVEAANDLPD